MDLSEKLDAIAKREKAATPGPWATEAVESGRFAEIESRIYSLRGSYILLSPTDGEAGQAKTVDAEFIAAARTDVPFLLGLVREQSAKLAKVEELIGWLDAASADDEPLYAKGKVSARATAKMLRDAIGVRA